MCVHAIRGGALSLPVTSRASSCARISARFLRLASGRPSTNFCVQTKPSVKRVSVLKWPASIGGNLYGLRSSPIRQRFSSNAYFSFFFFFLFSLLFLFFSFSHAARAQVSRVLFSFLFPRVPCTTSSLRLETLRNVRFIDTTCTQITEKKRKKEGEGGREVGKDFFFFLFFYITALLFGREENGRTISRVGKKGGGKEEGERWSVDVEARVSKTL